MPAVATISGIDTSELNCKRIKAGGKKKGCTQLLCETGQGATGWQIMKGSRRCSRKRR